MFGPNVTYLELGWTAVAAVGAGFGAALLAHVWMSYQTVMAWIADRRMVRWGPRHKFATGFMLAAGLLLLVWLGFVALGVNAMLNQPPTTPDRTAASERAGMILIALETVLLIFQVILTWAWVAVGQPTFQPGAAPNSPITLLFRAIDKGREIGHMVNNEAQAPLSTLELFANDPRLTADQRELAAEAVATFERMLEHTRELHDAIRALEAVEGQGGLM